MADWPVAGVPRVPEGEATAIGSPNGRGARWGPVDDDPVGTASARLLAAGVGRRDRLDALSLLGLLGDHADHDGLVRLPLSTLAGEFSMPAARARRLLAVLVEVGAVAAREEGLAVVAWQPSGAEGLRLAAFLANVATVVDAEPDGGDVLLTTGSAPPAPPLPTAVGAPRRRREPVLVAALTAAAALLATLAPSPAPSTALRTVTSSPLAPVLADGGPPSPAVSGSRAEAETSPAGPAPPGPASAPPAPDALGTEERPGLDSPAVATGLSGPSSDGPASVAGSPDLAPAARTARGSPVPSRSPSLRSPAVPSPSPSPGASLPEPTPPPSPSPPAPGPVVCPIVEAPFVIVDSVVAGGGPVEGLAGFAGPTLLEITGTVVNPAASGVVIGLLEIGVDLGQGRVVLAGSPPPITVPAEGDGPWRWTSTLPAGSATPDRDDVDAVVLRWRWLDAALAEACPT